MGKREKGKGKREKEGYLHHRPAYSLPLPLDFKIAAMKSCHRRASGTSSSPPLLFYPIMCFFVCWVSAYHQHTPIPLKTVVTHSSDPYLPEPSPLDRPFSFSHSLIPVYDISNHPCRIADHFQSIVFHVSCMLDFYTLLPAPYALRENGIRSRIE